MLSAVNLWQAAVAFGLAVLGVMHLLNPYIILASAFLFGVGFAFGSPASAAVIAEMVPAEDLLGANNLGGLQMNISGIVGPVLGGILIPIVGASFLFAFNGVGFLLVRHPALETGKAAIGASAGKLFRVVYHCHSLRALYSGYQDYLGEKRVIFIFHFYHLGADARRGSGGVAPRTCQPWIFVHQHGDRLGHRFHFPYSVGTFSVFTATVNYVRQCFAHSCLPSHGDCSLDEDVFGCRGTSRHRMDPIFHRALDSRSARNA